MIIASIVTLLFIVIIANCIVEAVEEGWRLSFSKISKAVYEVIVSALLVGLCFVLGKCGCTSNEEHSPSGESTLEHYEPR